MCQTHVKTQSVLCSFFGKFGMLCIPVTPVFRSVLFPYYDVIKTYKVYLGEIMLKLEPRGIFRALPNIYVGKFCENS